MCQRPLQAVLAVAPDASGTQPRARSIMLLSTAVGALTLARAVNNPQLANEVLNTVKSALLEQPAD